LSVCPTARAHTDASRTESKSAPPVSSPKPSRPDTATTARLARAISTKRPPEPPRTGHTLPRKPRGRLGGLDAAIYKGFTAATDPTTYDLAGRFVYARITQAL
jgi:hypothetical protein